MSLVAPNNGRLARNPLHRFISPRFINFYVIVAAAAAVLLLQAMKIAVDTMKKKLKKVSEEVVRVVIDVHSVHSIRRPSLVRSLTSLGLA